MRLFFQVAWIWKEKEKGPDGWGCGLKEGFKWKSCLSEYVNGKGNREKIKNLEWEELVIGMVSQCWKRVQSGYEKISVEYVRQYIFLLI